MSSKNKLDLPELISHERIIWLKGLYFRAFSKTSKLLAFALGGLVIVALAQDILVTIGLEPPSLIIMAIKGYECGDKFSVLECSIASEMISGALASFYFELGAFLREESMKVFIILLISSAYQIKLYREFLSSSQTQE